MAKKFNLAALMPEMEAVSNSDTPRITMIPIAELRPNGANFYDATNIDDLADSIELNGLLEPLCVFRRGQGTGSYVIFSGHRRFKAIRTLYERSGFARWQEVPCIVYPDPNDQNREMVMLIHANSTGRILSNWEKAEQALRLKKALVAMRENGAELPGRIRDLVAEEMNISASKVARLEAIGNNLTHPVWAALWKNGSISESAAYELSKLDKEEQGNCYRWLCSSGKRADKITPKDVAEFLAGRDVSKLDTPEAAVSELDTGNDNPSVSAARCQLPLHKGTEGSQAAEFRWRRCFAEEPDEGQFVLVFNNFQDWMPELAVYRNGQFIDENGRGSAMEVASYYLWLPLPPLPKV